MNFRSCLQRMLARRPTCWLTAPASRAVRGMARPAGRPSGASSSSRRARLGCPIRSLKMAAASAWRPVSHASVGPRQEVRALARSREKAADWMDKGVELVDGEWNDTAAIERALDGVDGAFVMLPAV